MLVNACPSFADKWEQHKLEYHDEDAYLPYAALGELGNHLIESHEKGEVKELTDVFAVLERLHVEGDEYVREAATIGLLESLLGCDPEILKFLLPESAKWWEQLNLFWNGKISYVGETFNNYVVGKGNGD